MPNTRAAAKLSATTSRNYRDLRVRTCSAKLRSAFHPNLRSSILIFHDRRGRLSSTSKFQSEGSYNYATISSHLPGAHHRADRQRIDVPSGASQGAQHSRRLLQTTERAEGRDLRRSYRVGRNGRCLLQRRLPARTKRPHRLRAPVRAHDVSGLGEREEV